MNSGDAFMQLLQVFLIFFFMALNKGKWPFSIGQSKGGIDFQHPQTSRILNSIFSCEELVTDTFVMMFPLAQKVQA